MPRFLTTRRALLSALASLAIVRRTRSEEALGLHVRDLVVREIDDGMHRAGFARRFTLLLPNHIGPNDRVPLLVLLHGLAETIDPKMGAHAWLERYGVGGAYDRLRRPPIAPISSRGDWMPRRLSEINADLAARPFQGLAIACPYTPNPWKTSNARALLDAYAAWIANEMIPRCRADAPIIGESAGLDGCSLGGYVGLEVFTRHPEAFASLGVVQSAIGEGGAAGWADRLAKAGARKLHVESSSLDPYRAANERLAAELSRRNVPVDLRIAPGPHDQPWLRETGTIEMLLWHDRALRAST